MCSDQTLLNYRYVQLRHFLTIDVYVTRVNLTVLRFVQAGPGVNVVVWISEAFRRGNDLQRIRTRLLHH